ncbi:TetR/AcrR family transcriptional regulator [Geminicoccus harenae]|uniref:TetR/AcrR family transcriptional regulator n=1 Tax=Geminicoccus harenae TaxID=2498453 RepID=UPI00168C0CCF|nr:TetR/AcrR family transcriptional regulator [Geminicoccus harenae]
MMENRSVLVLPTIMLPLPELQDCQLPGEAAGKPQAVLHAARMLFAEKGYAATSMDDIARKAKVGKATVYEHFQSKQELFATVVLHACQGHGGMVALPGEGDLRTRLVAFAEGFLDFILRPDVVAIYRTIMAESVRAPELGMTFYENGPLRLRGTLARVLAEAAGRGEIEVPDPERAAVDLISLIRADLHLRALFAVPTLPHRSERALLARTAVDRFLKAYAPGVA